MTCVIVFKILSEIIIHYRPVKVKGFLRNFYIFIYNITTMLDTGHRIRYPNN